MCFTYLIVVLVLYMIIWIHQKNTETFTSVIDHPTRCFDCEKNISSQCAWVGQKTKCFKCEQEALIRSGGDGCAVFHEHPIKYYERPPIPGMGYPKMGYM